MKRSDFFIRLTTGVLFLAVVSYIGVYVYSAVINTFVITTAVSYSIVETFPAQGFVVRSEEILAESRDSLLPIVGEGEKVASGQAIALEFLSTEAFETAAELSALRMRVAQLEALDNATVEATRLGSVMELSRMVNRSDFSRLDQLFLNIESFVFAGDLAPEEELPGLNEQIRTLEGRTDGLRTVHAPLSGTFSQAVDGFEHISPDALADITPTRLIELFSFPSRVSSLGKLVTEFKWYFAAVMDLDDAIRLPVGRRMSVQFLGAYQDSMEMLVERVGRREDGRCVVIFSSDRDIHNMVSLRAIRAEVVFDIVSGIRVPKEAIHLDYDGATFVFLQTGVRAERVEVEILLETADSYLVRDGALDNTPLRAGSTIIVRANDLYDGKVVG